MAALLRHGMARRIGGSVLQRIQAAFAEEPRRLLPRRMLFISTEKRASEEIARDIQRKQQELRDAIEEGKRSIKAAADWRKEQKLFDAISKARRSIAATTDWCDEDLQEYFRRPKPHQIFLEFIVGLIVFLVVAANEVLKVAFFLFILSLLAR